MSEGAKSGGVTLTGIQKSFGGAPALVDGRLTISPGGVHGLVGPNGAGKSTLAAIASGILQPDAGTIEVRGESLQFRGVPDALAAGIVAMPQELTVVPELSVAENITIGREPSRRGLLSQRASRAVAAKVLERMRVDLPLKAPVADLEPASQRVVMLARSLHTGAHTLILDEPTAALDSSQAEVFLRVVESLRGAGVSVVYISHRFGEVVRLCDDVTILRDGRTVDVLDRKRNTEAALVAAVVGEGALDDHVRAERSAPRRDRPVLTVRGLAGARLRGVDFSIGEGEILGVCGLPGSGVDDLMEMVSGCQAPVRGEIVVDGRAVRFGEPAQALARGISYLPAERARAGMLDLPIRSNLVASSLGKVDRAGWLTARAERRFVNDVLTELGLAQRVEHNLRTLSGGNRQKVLLSRCLLADSRLIVLDDPTVGVDVGARRDIHEMLVRIAAEGRSLLVSASEPEELVSIADRVLVLSRGEVGAEIDSAEISPESVVRAVTTSGAPRAAATAG